jgi:hypothetical protein
VQLDRDYRISTIHMILLIMKILLILSNRILLRHFGELMSESVHDELETIRDAEF